VSVRRAPEHVHLQPFLAELLFVAGSEVLDERVCLLRFQALEILLPPAVVEKLRQHNSKELLPVVAVDDSRD
jgi:hypothetical protein